jgi:ABC-type Fe3+ transport system permease subunit
MQSSNHRASFAVLLGLIGTLALPAGIALAQQSTSVSLLDAAWAIPLAAACGVGALLFVRGARGRIRRSLERAGGAGRIRTGLVLGVAGICFALSGSIAVGVYELLLRLEK